MGCAASSHTRVVQESVPGPQHGAAAGATQGRGKAGARFRSVISESDLAVLSVTSAAHPASSGASLGSATGGWGSSNGSSFESRAHSSRIPNGHHHHQQQQLHTPAVRGGRSPYGGERLHAHHPPIISIPQLRARRHHQAWEQRPSPPQSAAGGAAALSALGTPPRVPLAVVEGPRGGMCEGRDDGDDARTRRGAALPPNASDACVTLPRVIAVERRGGGGGGGGGLGSAGGLDGSSEHGASTFLAVIDLAAVPQVLSFDDGDERRSSSNALDASLLLSQGGMSNAPQPPPDAERHHGPSPRGTPPVLASSTSSSLFSRAPQPQQPQQPQQQQQQQQQPPPHPARHPTAVASTTGSLSHIFSTSGSSVVGSGGSSKARLQQLQQLDVSEMQRQRSTGGTPAPSDGAACASISAAWARGAVDSRGSNLSDIAPHELPPATSLAAALAASTEGGAASAAMAAACVHARFASPVRDHCGPGSGSGSGLRSGDRGHSSSGAVLIA